MRPSSEIVSSLNGSPTLSIPALSSVGANSSLWSRAIASSIAARRSGVSSRLALGRGEDEVQDRALLGRELRLDQVDRLLRVRPRDLELVLQAAADGADEEDEEDDDAEPARDDPPRMRGAGARPARERSRGEPLVGREPLALGLLRGPFPSVLRFSSAIGRAPFVVSSLVKTGLGAGTHRWACLFLTTPPRRSGHHTCRSPETAKLDFCNGAHRALGRWRHGRRRRPARDNAASCAFLRRRRVVVGLQLALVAVVLAFFGYVLRDVWADAVPRLADTDPVYLVAALAVLAAYYLLFAVGWWWLLAALRIRVSYGIALQAEMASMLAKYIPGGIWTPLARIVWLRRAGGVSDTSFVISSILLEAGLSAVAGILVFTAAWPRSTRSRRRSSRSSRLRLRRRSCSTRGSSRRSRGSSSAASARPSRRRSRTGSWSGCSATTRSPGSSAGPRSTSCCARWTPIPGSRRSRTSAARRRWGRSSPCSPCSRPRASACARRRCTACSSSSCRRAPRSAPPSSTAWRSRWSRRRSSAAGFS